MDLLFTMCTPASADEVVKELLAYLVVADFSMREELVLKIAFLAEKFAPSVQWWVQGWPGGRVRTQRPVVGAGLAWGEGAHPASSGGCRAGLGAGCAPSVQWWVRAVVGAGGGGEGARPVCSWWGKGWLG